MVALCVTANNHYLLRRAVFSKRFLRRLCTDFVETLPHDVSSSATEKSPPHILLGAPQKEIIIVLNPSKPGYRETIVYLYYLHHILTEPILFG